MVRLIVCVALYGIFLAGPAIAQISDDFSDGDLIANPAWTGTTNLWTVTPLDGNPALRNDGLAASDTVYLATPSMVSQGSWLFIFAHREVNLSNFSGARVYLIADTDNLRGEVRGYYVQLGTNNSDEVRLYRQDGDPTNRVLLGASTDPLLAGDNNTLALTVTRSETAEWSVSVGGQVVLTAADDTYLQSTFFGVWVKHTATANQNIFFDDFVVDGDIGAPDTTPPVVSEVNYFDELPAFRVDFSEPIDGTTASQASFAITNELQTPVDFTFIPGSGGSGSFTIADLSTSSLPSGNYTVAVMDLEDLAGNVLADTAIVVSVVADMEPPQIADLVALDAQTVRVTFDENTLACSPDLYEIDNGIGIPEGIAACVTSEEGQSTYDLLLSQPLVSQTTYTLTARNIPDVRGNVLTEASAMFTFIDPNEFDQPTPSDIVINEIMYDPPETEQEYVELFNRSDKTFDLSQFHLADNRLQPVPVPTSVLLPGDYAVLVRDAAAFSAAFPGVAFLEVGSWPALNNDGDTSVLFFGESVIDSVAFLPSFGGDGVSLERIDPEAPSAQFNFGSSVAVAGGTPGEQNSIFGLEDTTPPEVTSVRYSADLPAFRVDFSEPIDGTSATQSSFAITDEQQVTVDFTFVPGSGGSGPFTSADLVLNTPLSSGNYSVAVMDLVDLSGNALADTTAVVSVVVDVDPPQLVNVVAIYDQTVRVTFNEGTNACTTDLYEIDNEIGRPTSIASCLPEGGQSVYDLILSQPLVNRTTYTLTVRNIPDDEGNVLTEASAMFTFIDPNEFDQPDPGDIVINEIMYDPLETEQEYVELFNLSDKTFDLSQFQLADNRLQPVPIPPEVLLPGAYAVLVRDAAAFSVAFPGVAFLEVGSWPALNNGGDTSVLLFGESVVDSVAYLPAFGGEDVSLERIDPEGPSNSRFNFGSSVATTGGTPGMQNSIFAPDVTPPAPLFAQQVDPTVIDVGFNEPLDPASVSPASFVLDDSRSPTSAVLLDEGTRVRLTFATAATGLRLSIRSVRDLRGNLLEAGDVAIAFRPVTGDLLINEILFDPLADDEDNIPDQREYFELYNRSARYLSLRDAYWTDVPDESGEADTLRLGDATLVVAPSGFAIVFAQPDEVIDPATESELALAFPNIDFTAETITLIPLDRSSLSLVNGGDLIHLHRSDNATLDSVFYDPAWHSPNLIDTKGVALERIVLDGGANNPTNWTSSVAAAKGTPGQPNSVFIPPDAPPTEAGLTIEPSPFSPDGDGRDDNTVIRYALSTNVALIRVRIYDTHGRLVRVLEDAALSGKSGQIVWDGLDDEGRDLHIGIYVVLLEAIDTAGGTTEAFKKPVVLARPLN